MLSALSHLINLLYYTITVLYVLYNYTTTVAYYLFAIFKPFFLDNICLGNRLT